MIVSHFSIAGTKYLTPTILRRRGFSSWAPGSKGETWQRKAHLMAPGNRAKEPESVRMKGRKT